MNRKLQTALVWLVGLGIMCLVFYFGMGDSIDRAYRKEQANEMKSEYTDAEKYYRKTAKVVEKFNAAESKNCMTEKQAQKFFAERGFVSYPVSSDHTIDGNYYDAEQIAGLDIKHPSYQTNYISPKGDIWTIVVMDNSIMASPISRNAESESKVQLVYSETKEIMCYDGPTNTFFKTIPKKTALNVKIVEKIDSQTLDNLSKE